MLIDYSRTTSNLIIEHKVDNKLNSLFIFVWIFLISNQNRLFIDHHNIDSKFYKTIINISSISLGN